MKRRTADDDRWACYIGCGSYTQDSSNRYLYSGIDGDVVSNKISLGSSGTFPVFCFNI